MMNLKYFSNEIFSGIEGVRPSFILMRQIMDTQLEEVKETKV